MEENNTNYNENQDNNNNNENKENEGISQVTDPNSVKVICVLSYFWILFWLPLVVCKDNKFAKFHANQALINFIFGIVASIVSALFFIIPIIGWLFSLALAILMIVILIIQIIAVCNNEEKEIPIIGKIRFF